VKTTECDREPDVLEAVISGCWPSAKPGDELRAHASRCPECAHLAAVAVALRAERDEAMREARVPTSGQVWWKATMRSRAEAAAAVARPITLLQGLAGVCAAGMCAALIALAWPSIALPFAAIGPLLAREGQRISAVLSAAVIQPAMLSFAAVLGAALILSPFVLYFVLSDE